MCLCTETLMLGMLYACHTAYAADIYVSSITGSDTEGDGTQQKPFASLPVAQTAARRVLKQPMTTNLTIHVGAGVYYQRDALVLTEADSGRDGFRVKWVGPGPAAGVVPGLAAVVHGGVKVPSTLWKQIPGSSIWSADISSVSPPPPPPPAIKLLSRHKMRQRLQFDAPDRRMKPWIRTNSNDPEPGPPISNQTYSHCGSVLVDVSYNGDDLKSVWTGSIDNCCQTCAETAGCKAWSYCNLPPGQRCGSLANPVDCYLKTSIPTPTYFNQRVSGIPGTGCKPSYPPPPPSPIPRKWTTTNILENGVAATLARFPKSGSGYLTQLNCTNSDTTVSCPPGIMPMGLVHNDSVDMSVYANIGADWFTETRSVTAVTQDSSGSHFTFEKGHFGSANNKVYIQGSYKFITEPGEWAFDSENQILYLWPKNASSMTSGTADIVITTTKRIFDIKGGGWTNATLATAIDITGLVLAGTDFASDYLLFERSNDTPAQDREGMIRMENASHIQILDCALIDAGHSAIWLQGFCQNVTAVGNWIERPGFCGVYFQGIYPGDTTADSIGVIPNGPITSANESDVNKGHLFTDNFIHDYGKKVGHGSGFWFFQSGNTRLSNNYIQEGPRDAFGIYGIRFGNGDSAGCLPKTVYNTTLDFWKALEVLHTRNIEIDKNVVQNCVRDTADAGALEYWGVGAFNTAHHNCFSDMDPGVLDGSWMNFLFQDDASNYLNFSSNIVFSVHGAGQEEAGMIKSINSVFENNIIADSTLGHLFNLDPFIEPAANMIYRRNVYYNINSTTGNLDFSTNSYTVGDLANSASLKPFSNYGFEQGPPAGWPELSLDDKVIKEFDFNSFWNVYGYDNGTAMRKIGFENNSIYTDPLIIPSTYSMPWNRSCIDYIPAGGSPVYNLGFKNLSMADVGLTGNFKWDKGMVSQVNGLEKIQTERYNRMHGLWRAGSTGIATSPDPIFVFSNDAWARYDNVNVNCPAGTCRIMLRMKSSSPRTLSFAIDAPIQSKIIASANVPGTSMWQNTSIPVTEGLISDSATVFLMLNGSCDIDYFLFVAS